MYTTELMAFCSSFEGLSQASVALLPSTGAGYCTDSTVSRCAGCRYYTAFGPSGDGCLGALIASCVEAGTAVHSACPAGQDVSVTPIASGAERQLFFVVFTNGRGRAFAEQCCEHAQLVLPGLLKTAAGLTDTGEQISELESLAGLQLQVLEKQLKPHFLFNTLSLIARLIVLGRYDDALEAVYALSKMLRYVMDHKKQVRLREEIQYLKNYMFIQQARFQNKFEFQLDISQNILNAIVPAFCLQVLMENSIKHGLDSKGGGNIVVWGRLEHNQVLLSVSDDGVGFPETLLDNAFAAENQGSGLRNLAQRIAYYYGEPYGLRLGRSSGGGAEVSLTLPFCPDEEESFRPSFWFN